MTRTNPVKPQIHVGLDDQRSILYQLYQLTLNIATSHEDLERTWDVLSRGEQPNIIVHLPPRNRDFERLASFSISYKGFIPR